MKRVMSIILCLTMLFVMAAVPALAAEGKWVEIINEDFTKRTAGEPFDVDEANAITYDNAKAYIYETDANSANVSHTVAAYESNNALKISRTGEGTRKILFKPNNALSGQVEISFKFLSTIMVADGSMIAEVFGVDNTLLTGTIIDIGSTKSQIRTSYNGTARSKANNASWLSAGKWISVKYVINTDSGNVDATYTDTTNPTTNTVTRSITGSSALSAVSGICIRSEKKETDLYVDDLVIKYYEEPAAAESEFDFDDFKGENVSAAEITKSLVLPSAYTDSKSVAWNITWASSDASVINPQTGAVTPAEVDKEVTLTATFTGTKTFTKEFTLTVPALLSEFDFSDISSESINAVTNNLNLIDEFTDDAGREWAITWSSEDDNVIDAQTGEVTQGGIDERVTLTAALTYLGDGTEGELALSRSFNVKVLAAGTYHVNEGFDAEGDYSGHNAIKTYTGKDKLAWGVAEYYMTTDLSGPLAMNANIATDPENSRDKVLKLHRIAVDSKPDMQRVWTQINSSETSLNDKVYVGMRILREKIKTPTDIYFYDTNKTRLMYLRLSDENNRFFCYYGADSESYRYTENAVPAGDWFDLTIELDMKNGKYSTYINGVLMRADLAMHASGVSFGGLMFDLARGGYTAESITYVDDLTVRTTDGFPYSIVEYNFTDADGYPTKSAVGGGKLESVTMRKMSSIDKGTEPKLYVGFFKDELLCDVVPVPLDEAAALGGFEAVVDKSLPDDILDYEIKAFVFSKNLVPLMNSSEYVPFAVNPTIFVAGDSLGAYRSAKEYPQSGYAQELGAFFEDGTVNIDNHAISGRSSKSFYDGGSLDKILDKMYSGDYLLIQFGHNDQSGKGEYRETNPKGDKDTEGSFKYYLMKYIDGAKERGATPILVTPPARNSFNESGAMYDSSLKPYVDAMVALAGEESVQLVDLYSGWTAFVDGEVAKGIDSRNFYAYFYPNDPRFVNEAAWTGSQFNDPAKYAEMYKWYVVNPDDETDTSNHVHHDGTHLNIYGARVAAKIIADGLAKLDIGIKDNILENRSVEWTFGNYATFGKIQAR